MNWIAVDETLQSARLGNLLHELLDLLSAERQAIRNFDSRSLVAIQANKNEIAGAIAEIREHQQENRPDVSVNVADAEGIRTQRLVVELAQRVRTEARINVTLMKDCAGLVTEALGGCEKASAYDQKARCVTLKFPPVAVTAA